MQVQGDKAFSNQLTIRGKETILKCDIEAYYWRYQGNATFEIFDGHCITENRNKTFGISGRNNDIIIHNTTYHEAGKYMCYGRNASIISEIDVIVIGWFVTYATMHQYTNVLIFLTNIPRVQMKIFRANLHQPTS